ncbi:MAG: Hpt domain-containing protein [Desulfobulbus sp.]|nr:Hpt domain-containing protein [Desulfobulbus sp.]
MAQDRKALFAGYLEEVKSYIPIIHQHIDELRTNPNHSESFTELYRLVHIIKGASSMVGIQGLSRIAGHTESVLDEIQERRVPLSSAVLDAMHSTTLLFEQYCQGLQQGSPLDDAQLFDQTQQYFANICADESEAMFSMEMDGLIDSEELLATDPAPSDLETSLLNEFQAESEQHFAILEQAIDKLHIAVIGPTSVDDTVRSPLNTIRRSVHTLKGASAVLGLPDISAYAHLVEDIMDWFCESAITLDPRHIHLLSASIDSLAKLIMEPDAFDEQAAEDTFGQLSLCMNDPEQDQQQFTPQPPPSEAKSSINKQPIPPSTAPIVQSPSTNLFSDEELLMLRDGFREEAEEHLQQFHLSLESLEREIHSTTEISAEHREGIRTIRRSIHTIKGASSVIGLQEIASYAHGVEDFLDWLFEDARFIDPTMLNTLAEALDLLGLLVEAPETIPSERLKDIHRRLEALIETKPEQTPPSATQSATNKQSPPHSKAPIVQSPSTNLFSDEELLMLRDGFREEAKEHLQQLHQSMERLEREIHFTTEISTEHREEIRTISRSVHTIKGASSVIGLQEIASYAHGVEDCLDWLFEGARFIDPTMLNTLAEALDLLGLLVEAPETIPSERLKDVHRRLEALIETEPQPQPEAEQLPLESPEQTGVEADQSLIFSETLIPVEKVLVPEQKQTPTPAVATETAKTIRINQGQLDTLINLTNELLVGVSGFDQDMEQFNNALNELDLTTRRLKDIALELETKFEVKALDRLSERFTHLNETFTQIKSGQSFAEFDALELDRYTQLNLIIRSLNESTIDVSAIHSNLGGIFSGINGDISRQHRVIRELQVHMMRARMSPLSTLSSRLHRTVRDVASRLGKPVRLVMEGERVELDRTVWEKLADPLMHLIRNAVHHGVESKERRLALNKPTTASIMLSAHRERNHIVLRFSDDGQGLDFEAIKAKARKFGLGAKVDHMDERQLVELIFYPGFSTKTISEISGRGVGMDVVRESVKELQGSIITETFPGKGTAFVLRIPLTLGIVRALLVKIGEITYGIPLNDILDIQRLDSRDVFPEKGLCTISGATVNLYALPTLLGVSEEPGGNTAPLALTIKSEGRMIALSVPQISGQKEIVVKGLGSHLKTVPGVSGAAVMGDGSIVPVLDIPDLIQAAEQESFVHSTFFQQQPIEDRTKTILIVDDSISIRRVMSRLVTASGWNPVEAKDGQDAFGKLEAMTEKPDCILLDIEMPNMNGFEFLTKLPNIAGGDSIPVIMLTSRTSDKHREKAFQLGAKAFLNKPCKDEEFVDTVTRLTQAPLYDEVAI